MTRKLRLLLIFAAVLIGGVFIFGDILNISSDTDKLISNFPVICLASPDDKVVGTQWRVTSFLKGEDYPNLTLTTGTIIPKAFSTLTPTQTRPDALIAFYQPKFVFFGPLEIRTVILAYSDSTSGSRISLPELISQIEAK